MPHMLLHDIIGPIMVGPSSSHTAGALAISAMARKLVGSQPASVTFKLYGSFAHTYSGHGTDRALVAGALGLSEQDERLRTSFEMARAVGLEYDFYTAELDVPHENAVKMTFTAADGSRLDVVGASLGGGRIVITRIGEYPAEITADAPTLVIVQNDRKGMVSRVSQILAAHDINIGVMRLSRTARGEVACCVIETDGELPGGVLEEIRGVPGVLSARAISA